MKTLYALIASLALAAFARADFEIVKTEFIEDAPAVPEVHASSITETKTGALLATWFGGSRESEPDVAIWLSRYENGKWSPARIVASGNAQNGQLLPAWNPVLYTTTEGAIHLFYKVGATPQTWWGEVVTSTDDGITWSRAKRLPKGILGPIKNKPILLPDGKLLCPSSDENPDTKVWTTHIEITDEKLSKWTRIPNLSDPAKLEPIQPSILRHKDGSLQILARSKSRNLATATSTDNGATWSKIAPSGLYIPNSGTDAVTLADGSFLLVQNPSTKEIVAKDLSRKPPKWGDRFPITLEHSADGKTWTRIFDFDTSPVRNGYSYPAIIQTRDGLIHITYTWNRSRIKHIVVRQVPAIPPAQVIFDTDMGNDIDDALALAMLHTLQDQGKCNILAITLTRPDHQAALFVSSFNNLYKHPSIPIGENLKSPRPNRLKYADVAKDANAYPRGNGTITEAIPLLRKTLADAPDNSITLIQVGFFTNLALLLDSQPDSISPLDGKTLVAKKVKFLSLMGGDFAPPRHPNIPVEYNVRHDIPSARKVAAEWPTPMIWSGFEIGISTLYPATAIDKLPPGHLLRDAYLDYQKAPHNRPTWDPSSVLYAIFPHNDYFELSPAGTITVAEDGKQTFTPNPKGLHHYLIVTPAQARELQNIYVRLVQPDTK